MPGALHAQLGQWWSLPLDLRRRGGPVAAVSWASDPASAVGLDRRIACANGEDCASAGGGEVERLTSYAQVKVGTGDLLRMAALQRGRFGAGSCSVADSSRSTHFGATLV